MYKSTPPISFLQNNTLKIVQKASREVLKIRFPIGFTLNMGIILIEGSNRNYRFNPCLHQMAKSV